MSTAARFTLLAALALLGAGCATTRLHVQTPEGTRVEFAFPKNLDAEGLEVVVGPHSLRAARIRTDAAAIVREQGAIVRDVAATATAAALAP